MTRYERMRAMRKRRCLTYNQIALILNVKADKYARCERGEQDTPAQILISLAEYYKVSIDYILGLTDNPEPYRRKR